MMNLRKVRNYSHLLNAVGIQYTEQPTASKAVDTTVSE